MSLEFSMAGHVKILAVHNKTANRIDVPPNNALVRDACFAARPTA